MHSLAAVTGNAVLGKRVMVSPFAAVRGDEVQPLFVGDDSNVPAGMTLNEQKKADALPAITDSYTMKDLNAGVVHINTLLADEYKKAGI